MVGGLGFSALGLGLGRVVAGSFTEGTLGPMWLA